MGLIKAVTGAIGGTLADQWKDFYSCDAMEADWLVMKGRKTSSDRSSNKHGEENVITTGSQIIVADGQCMMIVEQGQVLELCAEPGAYTYDSSLSPSIFVGNLKDGLKGAALDAWERFKFGGGVGRDQRIYFFNTKEIIGNKYGTMNPIPFRVVDQRAGIDIDISVRCNGEYSYKIVNPMLFYTNVCGNISNIYDRSEIDSQLKSELLTALQPAFTKISMQGIRYSEVPGRTMEMADALNEVLSEKWGALRGLQIVSFGVNTISATPEDEQMLKEMQKAAAYRDPGLAAAGISAAQMDAMRDAANNDGGAALGFMGMGVAMNAGGNATNLYNLAAQQQQTSPQPQQPVAGAWTCACGASCTGNFCSVCGAKKPEQSAGWFCPQCGKQNEGNFCSSCGTKRP